SSLGRLFLSWGSAVVMTYSVLFASGKLIFREWKEFLFFFGVFVIALWVLLRSLKEDMTT
ncbi:MAG: hypothetical protein ISR55_07350, partial [Bacteroidetes bacterium]|nr:hypothetical protein [Bacteroidota bacterium]